MTTSPADGTVTSGDAMLAHRERAEAPSRLVVTEVRLGAPSGITTMWDRGASVRAWILAIAAAAVFSVLSVILLRSVGRAGDAA